MFLAFGPLFDLGSPPTIPRAFEPTCHIFYGERVIDVPDDLPKYLGHKDRSPLVSDRYMRADINGSSMAVHDGGSGTPLVLLHGFPMSSAIFVPIRPTVERIARLITPDLRGFGESEAPAGGYGMDDLADDVVAVADLLGLDRFVLGGHSMGGYVTFRVASRHRDRLAGLVLIDTRAGADAPEGVERRRSAIEAIEHGRRQVFLDGFLHGLVGSTTRSSRTHVVETVLAMAASVPDHVLTGCLRGMMERPDSRGLLAELDLPALVLVGAEDTLTPPDEAQAMVDALPRGQLVVVPDAGHTPTLEQPAEAGSALAAFLAGLSNE